VVDAVAYHHRPACAGARCVDAVTAVHVADALAHEAREAVLARAAQDGTGVRAAPAPPVLDLAYLATLGVDDTSLAAWRLQAAELAVADGRAAWGPR
jgi:hypothetical protein